MPFMTFSLILCCTCLRCGTCLAHTQAMTASLPHKPCWHQLLQHSDQTPVTVCDSMPYMQATPCQHQLLQHSDQILVTVCDSIPYMQATPANWPYNHDSIGKKGWAFLLPTVTPEDAKLHFPDHHSCKVHSHVHLGLPLGLCPKLLRACCNLNHLLRFILVCVCQASCCQAALPWSMLL